MLKKLKNLITSDKVFYGGVERIRTAVQAFAELCLATRPRRHFKRATNLSNLILHAIKMGIIIASLTS